MNKIEGAIAFIKAGDSIYQDFLSHFSEIDFEMMDDDEKIRKVNQYAILFAQIIEYYLKALILPDLRNENYVENSVDEMIFLSNASSGLKRFNHIYKRIIFDSSFDENIRNMIISELANTGKYFSIERSEYLDEVLKEPVEIDNKGTKIVLTDPRDYGLSLHFSTDNNTNNQKLSDLIDRIFEEIDKNSDSYPKSRYSMIDNNRYTACLEFLIDFTNAIRSVMMYKIKNCIKISGCCRYIFPDLNTEIKIIFDNDNQNLFFLDSSYNLWIMDNNGKKIDTIGYIWDYDIQTNKHDFIYEVIYFENGHEKRLKFDRKTGQYTYIKEEDKKEIDIEISKR